MTGLLDLILAPSPPPFALLHRPEINGPDALDIIVGQVTTVESLADIPLPDPGSGDGAAHEALVLVPYRQIRERGFAHTDDGTPLAVMRVDAQETVPLTEVLACIPDIPVILRDGEFDVDDAEYARIVRRVVENEIGRGEGANFVIKRSFTADISDYTLAHALAFFRRLLGNESGAYWTFVIHTADRTLVGATPERHISVSDGTAVMNPISGTYRYPPTGPTLTGVMEFLADRKETDELYMVVDEELKMMSRVCKSGCQVVGPHLREMARLAHTEYFIEGRTSRDARDILHETLFAPTVTGSPLESACQAIQRHERGGRGYYSGVVALIGSDRHGGRTLDSAILIRTADIDGTGRTRIGVGATLVRHSDPESEVAETRAKAAGLLAALNGGGARRFGSHPEVGRALARRNETISGFWLRNAGGADTRDPELLSKTVLVIDAEDTFTSMIAHQLRFLGMRVTVRRFDEPYDTGAYDLVVAGPGPGDPRQTDHPKIAHLRAAVRRLLDGDQPFLAVCLSHQVLSSLLGLALEPGKEPNQGVQKEIDLFGRRTRVGFYNTFAARCDADALDGVEISRDPVSGEVHALRGRRFASMQFHAESVLTEDGVRIMRETLTALLDAPEPVFR